MRLSFLRFYFLRLFGAFLALVLALLYLWGREEIAIAGFCAIALATVYITIRIARKTMPARCDLCGSPATLSAEHGAGFADARLILNCRRCGRVINTRTGSVKPARE